MTNTKIYYQALEEIAKTQAEKIGGTGFGSKNDCYGYLCSSSMSILNEKCIMFIYNTLKDGYNEINWYSSKNSFDFIVSSFNTCMNIVTIKGTFTLRNGYKWTVYDGTTADIEIKITLPQSNKEQLCIPHKHRGIVKEIKYGNTYYNCYPFTLTIK